MKAPHNCDHERLLVANLSIGFVPSTKLASFTFLGKKYKVDLWPDLLVKLWEILQYQPNFRSALHRFDQYVSEYNGFAFPKGAKRINDTNFLIMTDRPDYELKAIATELLEHFEYKATDLSFEYYSGDE